MLYEFLSAPAPTLQTFLPFSDDVSIAYTNEQICGPRTYTINEGYPFIQIIEPASGNLFFDPWQLSLETSDILVIGSHPTTL